MPELPRGTVAFLFTDIEGSTRRWERDAAAMRAAVEQHFAILDEAIRANRGARFKVIGDAVQAAFPTVPEALSAALAAQLALHDEPWGDVGPLHVRMAIHAGAAEPRDGDYLAPSLNRLARLMAAGHGRQILLTRAAAALARDTLPSRTTLHDLGEHRLRDLTQAEPVYQLLHPELPPDFPPLKSLDVPRHNLAPQPTPFIGREAEIARLVDLLQQPETRLVTLIGPGGVGKTRLALRVAEELLAVFPDGIWFVDLAPLNDPALVEQEIARVLGVQEESGRPLASLLAEQVATRAFLLVLDNFEQLLEAAPVVAELLRASPGSKALVTSRAPLRLRGEREIHVRPLGLPDGPDASLQQISQSEAVQLFVARAESVQAAFALTAENAFAVAEICRCLDGLPLAIELAAARVRLLPPQQLLARLDDRLRFLTGGPRDAPARQQTLRQTIAWSHDLLSPDEQALFRRLAVFADRPTLTTAEAVVDPDGVLDVFEGVASLVEKSLLQQEDGEAPPSTGGRLGGEAGEPRVSMLQTIRDFAMEQLAACGEEASIRDAQARHYVAEGERVHLDLFGPEQATTIDRFEADRDDLRGALHWLIERGDFTAALQLGDTLWRFWLIRGYLSEGIATLERIIAASPEADPVARARALVGAGTLSSARGDFDRASAFLRQAFTLAQAGGDDLVTARAHAALAVMAEDQGDVATAMGEHEAALALYQQEGTEEGVALSLASLGTLAAMAGDEARAVVLLNDAADLLRQLGDDWGLGTAKANLGRLAFANGAFSDAAAHTEEALAIFRRLGDQANVALLLNNLAEVATHQGEMARADALYEEGLDLARNLEDARTIAALLVTQAGFELRQGNNQWAAALLRESISLAIEVDDRTGIARGLEVSAAVASAIGEPSQVVSALAAAEALRATVGLALSAVYRPERERLLATARAALAPEAFAVAWEAGRAMSAEEAIAAARSLSQELLTQSASA